MSDAIAFFDAIAQRYDRDYAIGSTETRARMQRLLSELAKSAGADILDLGVGTGRELPALLDAGMRVTGFDASQPMLDLCARRARPIPLVKGDFYAKLPFPDASFDAVFALHGSLAHPPSPSTSSLEGLAKEVARLLRSNGLFAIEVPSPGFIAAVRANPSRTATALDEHRVAHVDPSTGATIEALIMTEGEWRDVLGPHFSVRVEPLSAVEQLILARR